MNGSLLTGVTGRVGQVVIYNRMGTWCVRRHVEHIRDARSEAQQRCRSRFVTMIRTASAMGDALATGLRGEARRMGLLDSNLFLRLNNDCFSTDGGSATDEATDGGSATDEATSGGSAQDGATGGGSTQGQADGGTTIDYGRLQLAWGPLAPVRPTEARLREGVAEVRFERVGGPGRSSATDHVHLYVFCPDTGQGCLSLPVYRMDRKLRLALPDAMAGHTLHCYLFCTAQDDPTLASPTAHAASPEGDEAGVFSTNASSPKGNGTGSLTATAAVEEVATAANEESATAAKERATAARHRSPTLPGAGSGSMPDEEEATRCGTSRDG